MSNLVRKFFVLLSKDERGATLVEYGIEYNLLVWSFYLGDYSKILFLL